MSPARTAVSIACGPSPAGATAPALSRVRSRGANPLVALPAPLGPGAAAREGIASARGANPLLLLRAASSPLLVRGLSDRAEPLRIATARYPPAVPLRSAPTGSGSRVAPVSRGVLIPHRSMRDAGAAPRTATALAGGRGSITRGVAAATALAGAPEGGASLPGEPQSGPFLGSAAAAAAAAVPRLRSAGEEPGLRLEGLLTERGEDLLANRGAPEPALVGADAASLRTSSRAGSAMSNASRDAPPPPPPAAGRWFTAARGGEPMGVGAAPLPVLPPSDDESAAAARAAAAAAAAAPGTLIGGGSRASLFVSPLKRRSGEASVRLSSGGGAGAGGAPGLAESPFSPDLSNATPQTATTGVLSPSPSSAPDKAAPPSAAASAAASSTYMPSASERDSGSDASGEPRASALRRRAGAPGSRRQQQQQRSGRGRRHRRRILLRAAAAGGDGGGGGSGGPPVRSGGSARRRASPLPSGPQRRLDWSEGGGGGGGAASAATAPSSSPPAVPSDADPPLQAAATAVCCVDGDPAAAVAGRVSRGPSRADGGEGSARRAGDAALLSTAAPPPRLPSPLVAWQQSTGTLVPTAAAATGGRDASPLLRGPTPTQLLPLPHGSRGPSPGGSGRRSAAGSRGGLASAGGGAATGPSPLPPPWPAAAAATSISQQQQQQQQPPPLRRALSLRLPSSSRESDSEEPDSLAAGSRGDGEGLLLLLQPARLNITRVRVLPLRPGAVGAGAPSARLARAPAPASGPALWPLADQLRASPGGMPVAGLPLARLGGARRLPSTSAADDTVVALDVEALPGAAVAAAPALE